MSKLPVKPKQNKGWPKIGTLRKGEDNRSYIKLENNVKILVDGVEVPLNKARTVRLEDPRKKVEGLLERNFIDEAEADRRLAVLAENTWLKYELIVPPPREEP